MSENGSVDGSVSIQVEMVVEKNDSFKEQVGNELRDGGTVSTQAERVVKLNEANDYKGKATEYTGDSANSFHFERSDTKMDDNMNNEDHNKENRLEQNDSYVASELFLKDQDVNEQVGDELTNEVVDEANENKDIATECSGSENAVLDTTDNLIPKNKDIATELGGPTDDVAAIHKEDFVVPITSQDVASSHVGFFNFRKLKFYQFLNYFCAKFSI